MNQFPVQTEREIGQRNVPVDPSELSTAASLRRLSWIVQQGPEYKGKVYTSPAGKLYMQFHPQIEALIADIPTPGEPSMARYVQETIRAAYMWFSAALLWVEGSGKVSVTGHPPEDDPDMVKGHFRDAKDLLKLAKYVATGNRRSARRVAESVDTIIRDEIPEDLYYNYLFPELERLHG